MLTKDEIKKRLKGVDPKLCTAFALRCSLRAMPLLAKDFQQKPFGYWQEDDALQYMLSLFIAQQVAAVVSMVPFSRYNIDACSAAASNAADAAYDAAYADDDAADDDAYYAADAAYTAAKAADAAADAAYAANAANAAYAYYAANAADAAYAAAADAADAAAILNDLKKLTNHPNTLSADTWLETPLWPEKIPTAWHINYQHFQQAVRDLDADFEIWLDWYQERVEGKPFDLTRETQWAQLPPEVWEQGAKAVNAYLASLTATTRPLNRVRAIFIGDGAAGKTSLIRRLHGETVVEGKEAMTPGIDIRPWSVPDSVITAHFWDFGGQVMSHAMHQFFLRARCLYILLLDAGSEREQREQATANDRAEYWLEHIKVFGNSAPVLLVGNKYDEAPVHLEMNTLTEKYPNIIDFFPVCCLSKAGYEAQFTVFHKALVQQLIAVDTHQVKFTHHQFELLEALQKQSQQEALLDHGAFDALYQQYCATDETGFTKTDFLGLLDNLGVIVHFPDLTWEEAYVLNPRWLTYGVYTLLYAEQTTRQNGLLAESDVVTILQEQSVSDELGHHLEYPAGKCRFIVDAMEKFGLCYRVQNLGNCSSKWVIPDKLPKDQPEFSGYLPDAETDCIQVVFDFDSLLPRSMIANLIVQNHRDIRCAQTGQQLVWQRGVMLDSRTLRAQTRLQVDYYARQLSLQVWGEQRRDYLAVLRAQVNQFKVNIKGLVVAEYVILPERAWCGRDNTLRVKKTAARVPYARLEREFIAGQRFIYSDDGEQYDLKEVMGFIMNKEQQKAAMNVTVHGNVGAIGGTGDGQQFSGHVTTHSVDRQVLQAYQEHLDQLMKDIEGHQADFTIKFHAYNELQQIHALLEKLTATPEAVNETERSQLQQLMSSVKDGTLGAIKLAKEIKGAGDTLTWLMTKAAAVSSMLAV